MKKLFNYVYITRNLLNNKQYIGDHSTNNLNDGYLGSGSIIKNAIKKYGTKNFKKEILENFKTKQKAFDAQEKYINEYNTLSPNGYNISSKGGHQSKGSVSKKTRIKISLGNKGKIGSNKGKKYSKETKEKMSISAKQRGIPEETRIKQKKAVTGKKLSEEHKRKISKSLKNKIVSKETKEKIYN